MSGNCWIFREVQGDTDLAENGYARIHLSERIGWKISGKHVTNPSEASAWQAWLGNPFYDDIYKAVFETQNRASARQAWADAQAAFAGAIQGALLLPLAIRLREGTKGGCRFVHQVVLANGALLVVVVAKEILFVASCYFLDRARGLDASAAYVETVATLVRRYAALLKLGGVWDRILPPAGFTVKRAGKHRDQIQFVTPETWGFSAAGIWLGPPVGGAAAQYEVDSPRNFLDPPKKLRDAL